MSIPFLAWLGFGATVGAYGTLVGLGGGFLIVPALLFVAGVEPRLAAGTSLAVVLLNAASGTLAYARERAIDWRTACLFAAATLPGAWMGPGLLEHVSRRAFQTAFGLLLVGAAGFLISRPVPASGGAPAGPSASRLAWGTVLSFFVGFISSMLGIGGGVIHMPVLTLLLGFPMRLAVATSQATLGISAAVGVVEHWRLGNVLVAPALAMGAGAVLGAQAGAALGRRWRSVALARALAGAVALVGAGCLWEGLR